MANSDELSQSLRFQCIQQASYRNEGLPLYQVINAARGIEAFVLGTYDPVPDLLAAAKEGLEIAKNTKAVAECQADENYLSNAISRIEKAIETAKAGYKDDK